jgi:hypothetical protein
MVRVTSDPQTPHPMHTHPNARPTSLGRERLLCRHIHDRCPISVLAVEAGISLRTASKWLARYCAGGAAALLDRRSVCRTHRRMGRVPSRGVNPEARLP